ncbi:carboxypeptidase-like regulatory domain-containing protein [Dyadobacter jiangsuensis]
MAINRAWSFAFVYGVVLNFAACRDKIPDTQTTIQGVVIDQDGRVIKNAGINMYGSEQRGLKQVTVFNVTVFTDANGSYKVSQLLPKTADAVDIRPVSSDSV